LLNTLDVQSPLIENPFAVRDISSPSLEHSEPHLPEQSEEAIETSSSQALMRQKIKKLFTESIVYEIVIDTGWRVKDLEMISR
jgi:hypothetical protein